jgi:hypothetical protein
MFDYFYRLVHFYCWSRDYIEASEDRQIQSQSHVTTDGQSVRLGVEPHQILITLWQLRFCRWGGGAPSLTRGLACHLSQS